MTLIIGVRVATVDEVASRISRHIHVQHGTGRTCTNAVDGIVTEVRERCDDIAVIVAHGVTKMLTIEQVDSQLLTITWIDSLKVSLSFSSFYLLISLYLYL